MQAATASSAARKVLIVDDSRAVLAILRRVVQKVGGAGVDVRSVTNGQDALDLVPDFSPDLIITDWHMPGVTGIEMLQTLRQTGHTKVRVGFVTSDTTVARIEEARHNGADFVVNKPFQDDELVGAIRESLQSAQGRPSAAPGASPMRAEVIERLLRVALKQLTFEVKECEPLVPKSLTPFLMRCHYGQGPGDEPSGGGVAGLPGVVRHRRRQRRGFSGRGRRSDRKGSSGPGSGAARQHLHAHRFQADSRAHRCQSVPSAAGAGGVAWGGRARRAADPQR